MFRGAVLLAVVGLAAGDPFPLGTMQALLEKVNLELVQMGLDVMTTRYLYYDYFLGSLELREARLGNLSKLQLEPGAGQEVVFLPEEGGRYVYNLTLALREAFLRFGFNYSLTPLISGSGQLNLTESGLSVRVSGSYRPGRKRECHASLESLHIRGLGDFSLNLAPSSLLRSLFSYIGEVGLRHSAGWFQEALNQLLAGSRDSAVVQDIYRTLLCG